MTAAAPDPLMGELLITVRQAAALLAVKSGAVRRMVRDGQLAAFQIGKIIRPLAAQVRRMAVASAQ